MVWSRPPPGAESKDVVHRVVNVAVAAGGTEDRPEMCLGSMYQRSFTDPDGHRWEYVWTGPAAMSGDAARMAG